MSDHTLVVESNYSLAKSPFLAIVIRFSSIAPPLSGLESSHLSQDTHLREEARRPPCQVRSIHSSGYCPPSPEQGNRNENSYDK